MHTRKHWIVMLAGAWWVGEPIKEVIIANRSVSRSPINYWVNMHMHMQALAVFESPKLSEWHCNYRHMYVCVHSYFVIFGEKLRVQLNTHEPWHHLNIIWFESRTSESTTQITLVDSYGLCSQLTPAIFELSLSATRVWPPFTSLIRLYLF